LKLKLKRIRIRKKEDEGEKAGTKEGFYEAGRAVNTELPVMALRHCLVSSIPSDR
jgi:hypothetical protein